MQTDRRWPFRVKAGRAVEDPEKLVTPGILYVQKAGDGVTVHLLALGWWDWHITFLFAVSHRRTRP